VTPERVEAIYLELEKYEIFLDPDPQSRGPKYLQGLIAECRNFLNQVSRVQLQVHREKQDLDRQLRAQEASFQVSFDLALANDERIRRLPNIEDRKSTAKVFLRDELSTIDALKAKLHDINYVEKAIRHRHQELTSTMGEIKLQKALILAEIGTGAFYGDERVTTDKTRFGAGPVGVDVDENELEKLFEAEVREDLAKRASVASSPLPPSVTPTEPLLVPPGVEQTVPQATPTDADVSAFLGVNTADSEFDDILLNLLVLFRKVGVRVHWRLYTTLS
jgi:hypothetical protein